MASSIYSSKKPKIGYYIRDVLQQRIFGINERGHPDDETVGYTELRKNLPMKGELYEN